MFSVFVVSRVMGTDANGYITNHDMLLDAAPLKTSENYKLEEENPEVYTDSEDEDRFRPRRQWPDKVWNNRKKKASVQSEVELKESLIQGHHLAVDMLRKWVLTPASFTKLPNIKIYWKILCPKDQPCAPSVD